MDKVEDGDSRDIETFVDEARLYAPKAAQFIRDEKWQSAAIILLERCKKLDMALQSLTPGGSEYVGDPERCVQRARENVSTYRSLWGETTAEVLSLRSELARKEEVLKTLCRTSRVLLQNAEGCAVNHYANDFQLHGPPGWIVDCEDKIMEAEAALQPSSSEVQS